MATNGPETCKKKVFLTLFLWLGLLVIAFSYFQKPFTSIVKKAFVQIDVKSAARGAAIRPLPYNYTTHDDGCRGFNEDPFHPSIAKYFKRIPSINCRGGYPNILSFHHEKSTLEIDRSKAASLKLSVDYCKYASLKRKAGFDNKVTTSEWSKTFTKSITLPEGVDYILGECFAGNKLVAHGYVSMVRKYEKREKTHQENYENHVTKNKPEETLSVLLMGIDGMSRQNLARQMPKTKDFVLKTMGGIELYKVNKVGLNTFPNVIPLLTGYSSNEVRKNWTDKEFLDKINHLFIWSEAKQKGYRTMALLDKTEITSFHYLKKGWNNPGFDVYNRPVVIKSEYDKLARRKSPYCVGDRSEMAVFYDQWLQMMALYNNSKTTPYFGYSFFAHLTHDFINYASSADEHYYQVLRKMAQQKSLNNTLFVFFSDHGNRYGEFRTTFKGMLEDNNPFMFFILPTWFRQKYPRIMSNLAKNQHRLVTNFDIHATLKDVLDFHPDRIASRKITKTKGLSLFQELPGKRTCEEAGIPLKYCNCRNISSMEVESSLATSIAKSLLDHITGKTKSFRKECVSLTLNSTMSVLNIVTTSTTDDFFQVTIKTFPGGALYEATLKAKKKKKDSGFGVVGDVARVNMYKGQADCIQDARIRPFCYCANLL